MFTADAGAGRVIRRDSDGEGDLAVRPGGASGLDASPSTVRPGVPFEIWITLRTTGRSAGRYTAEMNVGGAVRERSIRLDAGGTGRVSVTAAKDRPGSYEIRVLRTRQQVVVEGEGNRRSRPRHRVSLT